MSYRHEMQYALDEFEPTIPGVGTVAMYIYGAATVDFNDPDDWDISEIHLSMEGGGPDWSVPADHPLFKLISNSLCRDDHFLNTIVEEHASATEDDPDARREFIRDMQEYGRRYG